MSLIERNDIDRIYRELKIKAGYSEDERIEDREILKLTLMAIDMAPTVMNGEAEYINFQEFLDTLRSEIRECYRENGGDGSEFGRGLSHALKLLCMAPVYKMDGEKQNA